MDTKFRFAIRRVLPSSACELVGHFDTKRALVEALTAPDLGVKYRKAVSAADVAARMGTSRPSLRLIVTKEPTT